MPGFIVHPAYGEGTNDGKMEEGERHSGCSSGGTASETSVQPSRKGQTHPTTAATTRGQYDSKMLECDHKNCYSISKNLFQS